MYCTPHTGVCAPHIGSPAPSLHRSLLYTHTAIGTGRSKCVGSEYSTLQQVSGTCLTRQSPLSAAPPQPHQDHRHFPFTSCPSCPATGEKNHACTTATIWMILLPPLPLPFPFPFPSLLSFLFFLFPLIYIFYKHFISVSVLLPLICVRKSCTLAVD